MTETVQDLFFLLPLSPPSHFLNKKIIIQYYTNGSIRLHFKIHEICMFAPF